MRDNSIVTQKAGDCWLTSMTMKPSQACKWFLIGLVLSSVNASIAFGETESKINPSQIQPIDPSLKTLYQKAATANKTKRTFRYYPKKQYALNVYCTPSYCDAERLDALKRLFAFSDFKLSVFSERQNPGSNLADINIDVTAPDKIENQIDEQEFRANQVKSGKVFFFSDGSERCRVLSSLTPEQFLVNKLVIWVNGDLPLEQFLSCISISTARGAGLVINLDFESSWKENGELARLNSTQLQRAFYIINALLKIHFSSMVLPGLTESELSSTLQIN